MARRGVESHSLSLGFGPLRRPMPYKNVEDRRRHNRERKRRLRAAHPPAALVLDASERLRPAEDVEALLGNAKPRLMKTSADHTSLDAVRSPASSLLSESLK